jgi:hypothetical protein
MDLTLRSKTPIGKCKILPDDKIFFGSGGSRTIIVITKNNEAYKFFPIYYYVDDIESHIQIEKENTKAKVEIAIGKNLSKNIIDKGITPHFVKFYGYNECEEISKIFKKCPKYINFLESKKLDPVCADFYKGYPVVKTTDEFMVVSMEYCDYSSTDFLEDISKKSIENIEYYLDIFIFQIFFTILATRKVYPDFSHRDLFLRNILGVKQKTSGRFYRYNLDNIVYDVPVEYFFPKISDYGNTNLNKKYHSTKIIPDDLTDFFNITYDIYNGQNLGGQSLKKLFKSNDKKQKFLDNYFKTFFNPKKINKLKESKGVFMNWNWSHIRDEEFKKHIGFNNPNKIMKKYFAKKFKFDPSHQIEKEFGI